jgi:hypothetical protein
MEGPVTVNNLTTARLRLIAVAITVGTTTVLGLAGCAPLSAAPARPSPSESPSASGPAPVTESSSSATPVASATPTPPAVSTPTRIACDTLISRQVVYNFNPNFGLQNGYTPAAGSAAASAVADGGTACNWLDQTSGDTFSVAVARPAPPQLAAIRATASAGKPGTGLGDASYFSSAANVGRIDVFSGAYWLVATSVYFGSASNASTLVTAALGALK